MVGAYSIGNAQRGDLDPMSKQRKTNPGVGSYDLDNDNCNFKRSPSFKIPKALRTIIRDNSPGVGEYED